MGILFRIPVSSSPSHWLATLGAANYDYAVDVGIDAGSNVYVVGAFSPDLGGMRGIVSKYTPLGALSLPATTSSFTDAALSLTEITSPMINAVSSLTSTTTMIP